MDECGSNTCVVVAISGPNKKKVKKEFYQNVYSASSAFQVDNMGLSPHCLFFVLPSPFYPFSKSFWNRMNQNCLYSDLLLQKKGSLSPTYLIKHF